MGARGGGGGAGRARREERRTAKVDCRRVRAVDGGAAAVVEEAAEGGEGRRVAERLREAGERARAGDVGEGRRLRLPEHRARPQRAGAAEEHARVEAVGGDAGGERRDGEERREAERREQPVRRLVEAERDVHELLRRVGAACAKVDEVEDERARPLVLRVEREEQEEAELRARVRHERRRRRRRRRRCLCWFFLRQQRRAVGRTAARRVEQPRAAAARRDGGREERAHAACRQEGGCRKRDQQRDTHAKRLRKRKSICTVVSDTPATLPGAEDPRLGAPALLTRGGAPLRADLHALGERGQQVRSDAAGRLQAAAVGAACPRDRV